MHPDFALKIIPIGASQIQKQEMERSFYAGFFSALKWQLRQVAVLSDDDAEKLLEAGFNECLDYFKTLAKATQDISRQ